MPLVHAWGFNKTCVAFLILLWSFSLSYTNLPCHRWSLRSLRPVSPPAAERQTNSIPFLSFFLLTADRHQQGSPNPPVIRRYLLL